MSPVHAMSLNMFILDLGVMALVFLFRRKIGEERFHNFSIQIVMILVSINMIAISFAQIQQVRLQAAGLIP